MEPAEDAGTGGRRGRDGSSPFVLFAVGALALHGAIALFLLPGVVEGGLIETDGYIRLVRVERLWETWDWFDATLPRVNAPYGDTLHWTRPYDVWILLGAAPLFPFVSPRTAIHASAVASTPVLLVLACLAAVWAVRPLVPSRARRLAMLVLFFQAGVLMVSLPGRADHHTLILLALVLALGGLMRLRPGARAAGPGLALAFGLWVSSEFLVVWVAVLVALAAAWVVEGEERAAVRGRDLLAWTAAATTGALLIERGLPGIWRLEYDKISVAHLGVAALGCGVWAAVLGWTRRTGSGRSTGGRLGIVAATGTFAAGMIVLAFPGFFAGPWADLPPDQREFWFDRVREFQPLLPTHEGLGTFIAFLGPVIVGFAYAVLRLVRAREARDRWRWLVLTCLLLFYLPLGIRSLRFAPPAEVPAALALVAALAASFRTLEGRYSAPLATALKASLTLTLLGGFLVLGGALTPSPAMPSSADAEPGPSRECSLERLAGFLERPAGLGSRPRIILSHQDYSAELLYRTRHGVVATSFHRNFQAVWDVRQVLRGSDEAASRQVVERRGVDLVLLCPQSRGPYFRIDGPDGGPRSLYDRLVSGDVPAWLREVPLDEPGTDGFLLFEVVGLRDDVPAPGAAPSVGESVG